MSKTLIIFDSDSIVFTIGWRFRTKKSPNLVKISTNKFISNVLSNSGANDYVGFFAAKTDNDIPNFRYKIYPEYKANRPETPDFVKKWRPTIYKEFTDRWNFIPIDGMEADDAVAITANYYKDKYDKIVIATFDKDLKQIPNSTFYNMKDHTQTEISEVEAYRHFYTQMLMGDASDNIKGLPGVGAVGAKKILKKCDSEFSMFYRVCKEYNTVEDKLRIKLYKNKLKEVKESVEQDKINGIVNSLSTLTEPKFNRKVRLEVKNEIEDAVDDIFPGGWKSYYKQQHALLKMLTGETDAFTVPSVNENTQKLSSTSSLDVINAVTSITEDSLDDFLTV